MNIWQKLFLAIGVFALMLVVLFPPQFSLSRTVQHLPIWYGYPIDWLRLFFWIVLIIIVTGLGVTINKSEHYR